MKISQLSVDSNPYRVDVDQVMSDGSIEPVSIRCPHCNQNGVFHNALSRSLAYRKKFDDQGIRQFYAAIHQCPNSHCRGIVFIVRSTVGFLAILPPTRLDFDRTGVPENLLATLSEAVACHSVGAYRATALMVRRLLEEICDREGATGQNLHQRLQDLRKKVPLSEALLDGAMELKILGNDAAHIEAKAYSFIGKEEAEIAVEVAKEILKALYQHKTLIERMQQLKAKTP